MYLLPAHSVTTHNVVHCLDALTLCNSLSAASVDMILADLPYGTTACEWDSIIPLEPMWSAFKRIIKPQGAIVLTASQPFTSRLVMSNLAWFRYEWVWDKHMVSNIGNVARMPLRSHEVVLVFSAGNEHYFPQIRRATKPFGKLSATNSAVVGSFGTNYQIGAGYPKTVLSFPRPNNLSGGGLHPTQKPAALFEYLIRTYTQPGDLVFDPVVGSGTTAIAARGIGRNFICGDVSPEYVKIARRRLALPYTLPMFVQPIDYGNGERQPPLPMFGEGPGVGS